MTARSHGHAAGLLPVLDPAWRRKVFVGGLVLCIPVLGWPAVLGFRARFVRHLFAPTPAPLPDWNAGLAGFVREGLLAMAVIFGYLLPLYVVLAIVVCDRGFVPEARWAWLGAAFVAFPIFSTLSLPVACVALATAPELWLSVPECAAFLAGYAAIVFLVPAGFLEVTRTGRHRSAFALHRTLPFVARSFAPYCAAWLRSSAMSLTGHFALPLAPWGVVWCYLGILATFNELLLHAPPGRGWLQRAIADPRLRPTTPFGVRTIADGAGEDTRVLDLVWFSAPLPRLGRAHPRRP